MPRRITPILFTGLLALVTIHDAGATWSIIADHPQTQTITTTGASCSYLVYGIAQVLPGDGVVLVQADSNAQARSDAADWLANGDTLQSILARLTDTDGPYQPQAQQFALMRLGDPRPLTFTGAAVEGERGSMTAAHVSVQANTMASDRVVPETFAALTPDSWSDDLEMLDSVISALRAGASAGGDKRCGDATSASAYINVYRKDDEVKQPWLAIAVYGIEPGADNAVDLLISQYRNWRKHFVHQRSTSLFIIPAPASAEIKG